MMLIMPHRCGKIEFIKTCVHPPKYQEAVRDDVGIIGDENKKESYDSAVIYYLFFSHLLKFSNAVI